MQSRKWFVYGAIAVSSVSLTGLTQFSEAGAAGPATAQWHIQATVAPSDLGEFAAASCPSTSYCLAVGLRNEPDVWQRLLERWNGTKWAIVNTPGPSSLSVWSRFNGVSCSSAKACTAVGYYGGPTDEQPDRPLVDRWNGTKWSRQTAASRLGIFNSVACPTATSCFATGTTEIGQPHALLEHWNGKTWSTMTRPDPDAGLAQVTCLSTTNCTAVGGEAGKAVIIHWNGTKWSEQRPATVPDGRAFALSAVGCMSASNCFAAGSSFGASSSDERRVVERWNGTAWSIVFTPLPAGTTTGVFGAVACRPGGTCILAGYTDYLYSDSRTLVERWNGKAFAIEATPNRGASGFAGASCDPVKACIAVGAASNGIDSPIPLAARNP